MLLLGDENSRISILCNFRSFLGKRFKYEPTVCDKCHDLMINALSLGKFFPVDRIFYGIHFLTVTKEKAVNMLGNVELLSLSQFG